VAISESEVAAQLKVIKEQQKQLFEGPDAEKNEQRYRSQIVDFLVNAELIKQEAERLGIKISDKEVDARLKQVKDLFPKKSEFTKALEEQGLTESELAGKIREQLVADEMMKRLAKDIKISEPDKKKYYEDNKDRFAQPAGDGKEKKQMTYGEVADQVEQMLMREAQQAKFAELMNRLKRDAKIKKS
jgi:foldase protein PrsA